MSNLRKAGVGVALAIGLTSASAAQGPAPVALVVVNVKAVALGYRASKLIGSGVRNDKSEEIGKIDDLVVGKDKVLFAVIGVGGFLGLGAHLIAVPYNSLKMSPQRVVLPGATKEALSKLPEFHYLP